MCTSKAASDQSKTCTSQLFDGEHGAFICVDLLSPTKPAPEEIRCAALVAMVMYLVRSGPAFENQELTLKLSPSVTANLVGVNRDIDNKSRLSLLCHVDL